MATTFDATLKDMGRDSPQGFQAAFDRPPALPVRLLNVDLSAVTTAADLILGLGDPLQEIVQLDFQSSAAAWKHADVMVYHALSMDSACTCAPSMVTRCSCVNRSRTAAPSKAPRSSRGVTEP